jgi:hypothetical protein
MSKMKNIIKIQSKLALKQIHLLNFKFQVSLEYHLNQQLMDITKQVWIFDWLIIKNIINH